MEFLESLESLRPSGMNFDTAAYESASKITKLGIDMRDLEEYKEYYLKNTVYGSKIYSEINEELNDVIKKYSTTLTSFDENDKLIHVGELKNAYDLKNANEKNCVFFKELQNTQINVNRYYDSTTEITYPESDVFKLNEKDKILNEKDKILNEKDNKIYKRLGCPKSLHLINIMVEFVYMKLAYEFFDKEKNTSMSVPKPDIEFIKIINNDDKVSKCFVFLVSDDVVDKKFKSFEKKEEPSTRSISENELSRKDVKKEEIYKAMYENLIKLNDYGIYHNDVNPGNIFIKINNVTPKYEFKLIDFGNASTKRDHENQRNSLKRLDVTGEDITKMIPKDFDAWREGYISKKNKKYITDLNRRHGSLESFGGKRLSKKVNLKKSKKIKTKKRKRTNKKRKKNMRV